MKHNVMKKNPSFLYVRLHFCIFEWPANRLFNPCFSLSYVSMFYPVAWTILKSDSKMSTGRDLNENVNEKIKIKKETLNFTCAIFQSSLSHHEKVAPDMKSQPNFNVNFILREKTTEK